jgi:CDP-diacylglycerol--glycerol-3-phosphate 3-phosphatidyltransferase
LTKHLSRTRAAALPNVITLVRLAMVVPVVVLTRCSSFGPLALASVLFAIAAVGDWLDGHLARRLRAQSRLGALLDPVADKLMFLSVLFVFVVRDVVPLWLALLNLARELLVSALRHGLSSPDHVVGANWMGKTKFALQVCVVELAYLHLLAGAAGWGLPGGRPLVVWALIAVTAVSFAFLLNFCRWHKGELVDTRQT